MRPRGQITTNVVLTSLKTDCHPPHHNQTQQSKTNLRRSKCWLAMQWPSQSSVHSCICCWPLLFILRPSCFCFTVYEFNKFITRWFIFLFENSCLHWLNHHYVIIVRLRSCWKSLETHTIPLPNLNQHIWNLCVRAVLRSIVKHRTPFNITHMWSIGWGRRTTIWRWHQGMQEGPVTKQVRPHVLTFLLVDIDFTLYVFDNGDILRVIRQLAVALRLNCSLTALDFWTNSVSNHAALRLAEAMKIYCRLGAQYLVSDLVGAFCAKQMAEAVRVKFSPAALELEGKRFGIDSEKSAQLISWYLRLDHTPPFVFTAEAQEHKCAQRVRPMLVMQHCWNCRAIRTSLTLLML